MLFLLALALMTVPPQPRHPLCVQHLDAGLAPTRGACVEAGGPVQAAHVTREGALVALVGDRKGPLELCSWSGAPGASPVRHRLDGGGAFRASLLRGDGDLVLVAGAELLRVRPGDGRVVSRRATGADARAVAVAPEGAWLYDEGRLTWIGLDGARRELAAPSIAPEVQLRPRPPGSRAGREVELLTASGGELLVVEHVGDGHRVKGFLEQSDVTVRLGVTRVAADGRVVGQRVYDGARERREWFWSEKSSGNPGFGPSDFGLVRTRWSGFVELAAAAEKTDGSFVLALQAGHEEGTTLVALDRELRELWRRRLPKFSAVFGPPSRSTGLLFLDAGWTLLALDDAGGRPREAELPYPEAFGERSYRRAELGQTAAGEWVVAFW